MPRKIYLQICIRKFVLALLLSAISSAGLTQPTKPFNIKQLTDSIQLIVNRNHTPGLMLGITNKDSVIFSGGFGYADVDAKRPAGSSTLFRMGSITKMFVSLAVLQLIQQGKLGLNDELKKLAPDVPFQNKWEVKHPVRIIHLLEHTAGFDDMKLNRMCSQEKKEYTGKEMMVMQQNSLVCRWKPGERYSYCNPGYVVLGYIIEKITGHPYEKYIADNILLPLGMKQTNFNQLSKLPDDDTKQYVVHKGKIIAVPSVTILMGAAGALWSGSDDMLKFLRFFLNNGRPLFDSSVIDKMETTHSSLAAQSGLNTGYGLGNMSMFLYSRQIWHGHGGLAGTCFSSFAYNRTAGVGFVLSSNGNQPNYEIERLITDYLERDLITQRPDTIAAELKGLADFAGQYQFENPRNEISGFKDKLLTTARVTVEQNAVFVKPFLGDKIRLVQTGPLQFAHEGANASTFVFTTNEDGKKIMIMDGGYYEQTSAFKVNAAFWTTAIAILIAVSAVIAGCISFIGLLTGRVKKDKLLIYLLPATGVLLLGWAVTNLLKVQAETYLLSELTTINRRTLIIFSGTFIFGLLAVLHLVMVLLKFKQFKNRFFAFYWLLTAVAVFYIAVILFQNGWIGLRTWAM